MEPDNLILKKIGANIKKLRQANHIKQEWLGKKTGFSKSGISRLEHGERDTTLMHLIKIADVLQTPPAEFFKE